MAGSVVQNVVVNVQREKKKKTTRRRRSGKRVAPRSNNPLAYSGASSTHEYRIPTHSLQTNAALLMPARTLDDVRAGGDNLLGYVPRAPMPALAAVKTDGLLERVGQLEGHVKTGMRDAGKSFEHFDARLKTLQEHVGKSNLAQQRPIPRPDAPEPEAAPEAPEPEAPVAPEAAPAPEDAPEAAPEAAPAPVAPTKPKRPPFAPFKPTRFRGRTKEGTVKDKLRKQLMTLERAEYDSKRAAYERE